MPTGTQLCPLFAARISGIDMTDRQAVEGLSAVHDFEWSRVRVDPALVTEADRAAHPPVRQAMMAIENFSGPALYLGTRARSADGHEEAEDRAWIEHLKDFPSNPDFVYTHHWR